MKRMGFWLIGLLVITACNNGGKVEVDVDSLGKKIDTTAEKLWDSTKAKAKRLKDKIEDKIDSKDSSGKQN